MVCEIGKAVGAEGLVAGQIVDLKSEGMAEKVAPAASAFPAPPCGAAGATASLAATAGSCDSALNKAGIPPLGTKALF